MSQTSGINLPSVDPFEELDKHQELMDRMNATVDKADEAIDHAKTAINNLRDHNNDVNAHPEMRQNLNTLNDKVSVLEHRMDEYSPVAPSSDWRVKQPTIEFPVDGGRVQPGFMLQWDAFEAYDPDTVEPYPAINQPTILSPVSGAKVAMGCTITWSAYIPRAAA